MERLLLRRVSREYGIHITLTRDHPPETDQADMDRRIHAAYQMKGYPEAKAELDKVVRYWDGLNLSAARSLEEGLEETLTLRRLGIPDLQIYSGPA